MAHIKVEIQKKRVKLKPREFKPCTYQSRYCENAKPD